MIADAMTVLQGTRNLRGSVAKSLGYHSRPASLYAPKPAPYRRFALSRSWKATTQRDEGPT